MRQMIIEVTITLGLCWLALLCLSGCWMDQATAYKAIAGHPAPAIDRTLAGVE